MKQKSSVEDDIRKEGEKPSDFSKVTELLLNQKWRRRKTILDRRIMTKLSALDVISQIYDIEFLRQFIIYYTEYLTSVKGQGRQDIVDIAKFQHMEQKEMQMELINSLR